MLGTFQRIVSKWQFPKGIFLIGNFPNVPFPKQQLPKSVQAVAIGPQPFLAAALGPQPILAAAIGPPLHPGKFPFGKLQIWEVATWEIVAWEAHKDEKELFIGRIIRINNKVGRNRSLVG